MQDTGHRPALTATAIAAVVPNCPRHSLRNPPHLPPPQPSHGGVLGYLKQVHIADLSVFCEPWWQQQSRTMLVLLMCHFNRKEQWMLRSVTEECMVLWYSVWWQSLRVAGMYVCVREEGRWSYGCALLHMSRTQVGHLCHRRGSWVHQGLCCMPQTVASLST